MSARLWWVRHGPTHAKTMVGWSDLPAHLDDRAALERLAAALPEGAPVISSDLARAVQTAAALAGARPRLPAEPALREMHFGDWELRGHAEIEAETPALIRAFWDDPASVRPPGGETWAELSARVSAVADRLAAQGGDLVVVAHFGPILSQVQRARPGTGFAQRIEPLSLTRLEHGAAGWRLAGVNQRP